MNDLARFPTLVFAGKPLSLSVNSVGEALGTGATSRMASMGRMLSNQVEIINQSAEGLINFPSQNSCDTACL